MNIPQSMRSRSFALAMVGACALASSAFAQYPSDPALNLAVSDAASDQSQSKLAPTADGGTWVSWFDGIGTGWDVRIQKLDGQGNEIFAHNGLMVGDRSFSSTQDYGLDTSSTDDALIVFRDDRPGGTQITAAKVTAAGTHAWGATGVNLTSTGDFVANPKIAGTSDGGAVVAWVQNQNIVVQKLDAAGVPLWGAGVVVSPASGNYSTADLHDVGTGAILSLVHQTGGFSSPKHLRAQKFDGAGTAMWGATPMAIFDGGSLQFGNFPPFITDNAGGAIFSWYSSSPSLQCFAQRVNSAGVEAWAHNGVALATTAGNVRTDPSVHFDAAADEVYASWTEQTANQAMRGIHAQRLDASGARLWGNAGAEMLAVGGTEAGMARPISGGASGGALIVWAEIPSFGTDQLFGAHVDLGGTVDVARFDIASTPSAKSRLQARLSANGVALLSWKDARSDGGDIYAQSVGFDGSLGGQPTLGTPFCDPAVSNSSGGPAILSATAIAGGPGLTQVHLDCTGGPTSGTQLGYYLVGNMATGGFAPPQSSGLFCLVGAPGAQFWRYNVGGTTANSVSIFNTSGDLENFSGTAASDPSNLGFDVPSTLPALAIPLAGSTWHFQCWYRDNSPGVVDSNFSNGLSVTFP